MFADPSEEKCFFMIWGNKKNINLKLVTGLRFVATVATGGRVKFVPGVKIFPENNAISRIISVELKDLPTPSVILH